MSPRRRYASAGRTTGPSAGQMDILSVTGIEMEKFAVTSKTNTCRKCREELTDGNWQASRRKRHDYICNTCRHRENKAIERANGTGRFEAHGDYEFRGVDGEGGNVPDPGALFGIRHQYLSLRAGPDLLETGAPLTWADCLGFLADLPKRYIYVAYFFDYDVTMIIRTFPEERARRLLNRHLRMTSTGNCLPLDIGEFQVDYLQHKEFRVRRKGARHWTVISDVGQFFQSSFLSTIEKWQIGTAEERAMIARGKSMRAEFAEHNEEIAAYNALECLHLEQLMTDFRAVCQETGYVPKKWQGPGNLASAMLSYHKVPRRDEIPILKNEHFYQLALEGYYGGRFETTVTGPVPGPVHQYDINGAYVAALRTLPCLIHGTWKQVKEMPSEGIWFGRITFDHPEAFYLCSFPVRDSKGNICFPRKGQGVYWGVEISAACKWNDASVAFQGGWVYQGNCDCNWFSFVDDYYKLRLSLGKTTKGYVLKLAGNSIYGKLAQSIGYAPWANPVWAGIITAQCRAQIIEACGQHPDDIYMIATDGIFSGKQLDLPVSRELGEWEYTEHPDGIFIVQPGIYFSGAEAKSRGIERGRIHDMEPQFLAAFEQYKNSHGVDYTVEVPVVNFVTARQAIARNKWDLAGSWEVTNRYLSFAWANKRNPGIARNTEQGMRTLPKRGDPSVASIGYARRIGGSERVPYEDRYSDPSLEEAERMAGQPDWVQPML